MACLKLSFVVDVSSQIAQCKNYTDIKSPPPREGNDTPKVTSPEDC